MKSGKRWLAMLLVVMMLLGCLPLAGAQGAATITIPPSREGSQQETMAGTPLEAGDMELRASYDMSHAENKLVDITGNGFDAQYTGFEDADFVTEGENVVLTFDGTGNYIALPVGIIESEVFAIESTFQTNTINGGWL